VFSRDSDLERHMVLTFMNYQKIHDQIIERAKSRKLDGYKEIHHIIPRCLGGSDKKSNLVELTAREHFIIHKLLCKIYPDNKSIFYGYYCMAHMKNQNQDRGYKVSSKEYEELRRIHSQLISERQMGHEVTVETRKKLRDANLGKKYTRSNEYRKKLSDAHKGKKKTKQHRENLSKSHKGKIPWNKGKKLSPLSDEHKNKISNSLKGRIVSDETRNKISSIHKGKVTSEETKEKIRQTKLRNKLLGKYKK
jgi:hypothetical protein